LHRPYDFCPPPEEKPARQIKQPWHARSSNPGASR
jgi:hypothetical protein